MVKSFESKPYVFARSQSNESHLYWSSVEEDLSSSSWKMIGDGKTLLKTDASVAYNTLTKVNNFSGRGNFFIELNKTLLQLMGNKDNENTIFLF